MFKGHITINFEIDADGSLLTAIVHNGAPPVVLLGIMKLAEEQIIGDGFKPRDFKVVKKG